MSRYVFKKKMDWKKIMMLLLACVFLYSAVQIASVLYRNYTGDKAYDEIRNQLMSQVAVDLKGETTPKKEQAQSPSNKASDEADKKEEAAVPKKAKEEPIPYSFLKEQYPEMAGWIRFHDSKIDYPVMQAGDNTKYMTQLADGSKSDYGSIFLDFRNSRDFLDRNNILYGHNMAGGAMFNEITRFKDRKFYEKHKTFLLETATGLKECVVLSAYVTKETSGAYRLQFDDDNEYALFLQQVKEASLFDMGVDIGGLENIVTLSTCTNIKTDDRFVVHALIRDKQS